MALFVMAMSTGCSATRCKTLAIDILPTDKPKPAGKVEIRCDGKPIVQAVADEVKAGDK
jgi:hypothetical protein